MSEIKKRKKSKGLVISLTASKSGTPGKKKSTSPRIMKRKIMGLCNGKQWRGALQDYLSQTLIQERKIAKRVEITKYHERVSQELEVPDIDIKIYGRGIFLRDEELRFNKMPKKDRVQLLEDYVESEDHRRMMLTSLLKRVTWTSMKKFIRKHLSHTKEKIELLGEMSHYQLSYEIQCAFLGIDSFFNRKENMEDEETPFENEKQTLVKIMKLEIPQDLMITIFSYLKYEKELVLTVGLSCHTFFSLILQTWKRLKISPGNILEIPLLALRSAEHITLQSNNVTKTFRQVDLFYIIRNISPLLLKSIEFKMNVKIFHKIFRIMYYELNEWDENPFREVRNVKFCPTLTMYDNSAPLPVTIKEMDSYYDRRKWNNLSFLHIFPGAEMVEAPLHYHLLNGLKRLTGVGLDLTIPYQMDYRKKIDFSNASAVQSFSSGDFGSQFKVNKWIFKKVKVLVHPEDTSRIARLPIFFLQFQNLNKLEIRFVVKGNANSDYQHQQQVMYGQGAKPRHLDLFFLSTLKKLEELVLMDERYNVQLLRIWNFPRLEDLKSVIETENNDAPKIDFFCKKDIEEDEKKTEESPSILAQPPPKTPRSPLIKVRGSTFFPALRKLRMPLDHIIRQDLACYSSSTAEDMYVALSIPTLTHLEMTCRLSIMDGFNAIEEVENIPIVMILQKLGEAFDRTNQANTREGGLKYEYLHLQFVWSFMGSPPQVYQSSLVTDEDDQNNNSNNTKAETNSDHQQQEQMKDEEVSIPVHQDPQEQLKILKEKEEAKRQQQDKMKDEEENRPEFVPHANFFPLDQIPPGQQPVMSNLNPIWYDYVLSIKYDEHLQKNGVKPFVEIHISESITDGNVYREEDRLYREKENFYVEDISILDLFMSDFANTVKKNRLVVAFGESNITSLASKQFMTQVQDGEAGDKNACSKIFGDRLIFTEDASGRKRMKSKNGYVIKKLLGKSKKKNVDYYFPMGHESLELDPFSTGN